MGVGIGWGGDPYTPLAPSHPASRTPVDAASASVAASLGHVDSPGVNWSRMEPPRHRGVEHGMQTPHVPAATPMHFGGWRPRRDIVITDVPIEVLDRDVSQYCAQFGTGPRPTASSRSRMKLTLPPLRVRCDTAQQ